jgi:hypothetical protein
MKPPTNISVKELGIEIEVILSLLNGLLEESQGTNAPKPIFLTPSGMVSAPAQS